MRLEIADALTELHLHQRLADVDALLDHRNDGLELVRASRGRGELRVLLRDLLVERRNLCAMLGHLVEQALACALISSGDASAGGSKSATGSVTIRRSAACSRATSSRVAQ